MKKTTYQSPALQIIVCDAADVVTTSPVESVGSKWNENWNVTNNDNKLLS